MPNRLFVVCSLQRILLFYLICRLRIDFIKQSFNLTAWYISISELACKIGVCTDRQLSYAIAIFTQVQIKISDYQFEYRTIYLDPHSKPLMKIRSETTHT